MTTITYDDPQLDPNCIPSRVSTASLTSLVKSIITITYDDTQPD